VIQTFDLQPPLVFRHKLQWTGSGTMSWFNCTLFCY